jgi:alpha-glucosidase
MLETLEFWLGKGVDGFRVDVMWHLIKDTECRDNPPNPNYCADTEPPYNAFIPAYSTDQPEVHDVIARMRKLVDRYDQRLIIGEVYLPVSQLVRYYGEDGTGAHLPFNFQLVVLPWRADEIYAAITEYEATLPPFGWPNWVLGNHDQRRIATRVGLEQARVAALLLLMLRGTPTLYYGDELGMVDVPIDPSQYKDPQGINIGISRDPQRTPMQWDGTRYAGFGEVSPWLPVASNAAQVNVESQRDDPDSMLSFYRRLLALRRGEPALEIGGYAPAGLQENGFAFLREQADRRFLMLLNLADTPLECVAQLPHVHGTIVLGTNRQREGATVEGPVRLDGNEAVVIVLRADETT